MTRNLLRTMAASASVLPGAAMALGLGPIDVKSVLDQPLEAHIPIVSARPGELNGLTANLASRELFRRMGLERPALLRELDFSVQESENGTPYIRVTSRTPMREPSMNILLEVSWPTGRMLRDFSVLLDPPMSVRRAPKPTAVAVTPTSSSRVSVAPRSRQSSGAGFDGASYGPVAPGETLWSIAETMRPDGSISVSQMMLALLRANPDAFYQPNVNSLNAGATLRMPGSDELAALSQGDARSEVNRQHAAIGAAWATSSSNQSGDRTNAGVASSGDDSAGSSASVVAADNTMGLGQIRLLEADQGSDRAGTGEGSANAASGSGSGPLIQVESGGLALQLVGLEGLSDRMPTVIGVHDAVLATSLVGEPLESPVASSEDSTAEGDDSNVALADTGAAVETLDQVVESSEPSAVLAAEEIFDNAADGSDVMAAAQAFRAAAGVPSMAASEADRDGGTSERGEKRPPRLDLAAASPEASSADVNVADGLADSQTAAAVPVTAEPLDAVSETSGPEGWAQETVAEIDMQSEAPDWQGASVDPFEPADSPTAFDSEADSVYGVEGAATLPTLDAELETRSASSGAALLPGPKTIATYGGGLLGVLLLLLMLVRRALGGKDTGPEAAGAGAQAEPEEVQDPESGTNADEPLQTSAESEVAVLDADESDVDDTLVEEEHVDPAAKAEVLIAMGEFAQALDLLQTALADAPDNTDVALKILETHVSADDGDAFAAFSAQNRELLQGSGLWPQVVTMGTELCPEHELFGGHPAGGEEQHADAPIDESTAATQKMPTLTPSDQPVSESLDGDGADEDSAEVGADILEFKLPEEEEDLASQPVAEQTDDEPADSDDLDAGLDFDLEEFSLDEDLSAAAEETAAEPVSTAAEVPLELPADLEFDAPVEALSDPGEEPQDDATLKVESVGKLNDEPVDPTLKLEAVDDLDLDTIDLQESGLDFDLSLEAEDTASPADSDTAQGKDEDSFVDTKLDLATAYLEMGDNDGARSLYEEVIEEGNGTQRKMAEKALAEMA